MSDLFRPVIDFAYAGGVTMIPLLLCCTAMWYCILRAWFEVLPTPGHHSHAQLADTFACLCSGRTHTDARLAACLAETIHAHTRRRLSAAAVFAGVAPLLGLLGTVTGMIDTFDCVARFGMVNPKALSTGISQAMISTQTGLVVAVPGLIAVYFLRRRAHRTRERLERFGVCLANPEGGTA
ncbi:MotA/TolQ/ExbB proton channel family protein [Pseudodesulfovibrio sediminis]|uniref:MotA/TolQ/ExbB proton channel domain-containing protein n=1 Tax=Pseudodesulfovibrio sediminis TaxID=2810563 RepID=A0ABN6ESG3_9BACT|nr:MotA/TolQ/ExbB proton channel family protein [Pseudodesulfovibrio sediminis]BCS88079.1 hypothetical protein PSDVSF_13210 [Pseudodesulfovibrio sediminis]